MLTIRELAQKNRIPESSIRAWIKAGLLKAIKFAGKGKIYIDPEEWAAFVRRSQLSIQQDKDVVAILRGLSRKTA